MAQVKLNTIQIVLMAHYKNLLIQIVHIRVPRRDLIVTKLNGAKIATAQTCWLDHRKLLLQGFRCTCNPLCGIWLRSPLYEFML